MKAEVISNGKAKSAGTIVEVHPVYSRRTNVCLYYIESDGTIWSEDDIKVTDPLSFSERRAERLKVATAAMQGILSNDQLLMQACDAARENGINDIPTSVALMAMAVADALLAKVDVKGGSDDNCATQ